MKDNIRCLDPVMTEKKTMKETKAKREQIIEFIKNQIGVNVDDYRTDFTKQQDGKNRCMGNYYFIKMRLIYEKH